MAASNSLTIAPKQCGMKLACSNLDIWNAILQSWNVALSVFILSKSQSRTITSQEHGVFMASRNLSVWHPFLQRWNVTSSISMMSASHRLAITEKHRMKAVGRNLGVEEILLQGRRPCRYCRRLPQLGRHCGEAGYASSLQKLGCNAFGQRWNLALAFCIQAPSHCSSITSKQYIVTEFAGRYVGIRPSFSQRWNARNSFLVPSDRGFHTKTLWRDQKPGTKHVANYGFNSCKWHMQCKMN